MAALERGLGRGLDSLLRSTREEYTSARDSNKLALTQLVPGAHQPRMLFNETTLEELAASIKNQGVIQPLIVRQKADSSPQVYEIIAGERRWRAAKLAGLTEVPVVITSYTDDEAMTIALVENLQREDLNPVEEAQALHELKERYALSQEELSTKLGKSRPAIANALRLLQLPTEILAGLAEAKISAGHARALLALSEEEPRSFLYAAIMGKGLSVREAEAAVDSWKRTGVLPAAITGSQATKPASPRAPKPLELKSLQQKIRAVGHHGAMIGGSLDKGRVSLPYTSRGELEFILSSLGIRMEDWPDSSIQEDAQAVEQVFIPESVAAADLGAASTEMEVLPEGVALEDITLDGEISNSEIIEEELSADSDNIDVDIEDVLLLEDEVDDSSMEELMVESGISVVDTEVVIESRADDTEPDLSEVEFSGFQQEVTSDDLLADVVLMDQVFSGTAEAEDIAEVEEVLNPELEALLDTSKDNEIVMLDPRIEEVDSSAELNAGDTISVEEEPVLASVIEAEAVQVEELEESPVFEEEIMATPIAPDKMSLDDAIAEATALSKAARPTPKISKTVKVD